MSKRPPIKRHDIKGNLSEQNSSSDEHDSCLPSNQDSKSIYRKESCRKEKVPPSPKHPLSPNKKTVRQFSFAHIVLVVIAACIGILWLPKCSNEENTRKLKEIVSGIRPFFPNQRDALWNRLFSVLSRAAKCGSECPSVILLLNLQDKFSEKTTQCLTKMVGYNASTLFGSAGPLILNETEINKCKGLCTEGVKKLEEYGIVIIEKLEKLVEESAQALISYCDEYEANTAKVVYILTMTVKNFEESAQTTADTAFSALWPSMKKDWKDALVTRLASLVVFVMPEENLKCPR